MEDKENLADDSQIALQLEQLCFSNNPRIDTLLRNVVQELRTFTEEQAQHISELARIGKAMSAEYHTANVLEMILAQARKFTRADAGTLYLLTEDRRSLAFHVVHNDSFILRMGGTSGRPVTLPNVKLYHENGRPNHSNVSAHVALENETVNIADVYHARGFNFDGVKEFDAMTGYRSVSMLVVPMRNHEEEIIGVLQLINSIDSITGEIVPFSRDMVELARALASQAAVVLTQQQLIKDLRRLFESFFKAIAVAIEKKSRYTGGHIERVANLTMRLAETINETDQGPLAGVSFDEHELHELRFAAWMHDIGKITTPESVVDKASKLETVFDRIELIRTRFRMIRLSLELSAERARTARIDASAAPGKTESAGFARQAELAALDEDLAFIEGVNNGSEFMDDAHLERLKKIAEKTYEEDGKEHPYLLDEEVRFLSIRKGTLTDEERGIMNDHAMMTMRILECLPWPRRMQNVPKIAAAHHEKLDGSGYPLGLSGDQIGLQARIMAVADIFEALSARDRPYKKPMPLSKAIRVLRSMAEDHHIDKDVVELFIESGLVEEYDRDQLSAEGGECDFSPAPPPAVSTARHAPAVDRKVCG